MRKATSGFTIVELLIVIVVIAILAAISVVAYNGIQERANGAAITSQAGAYVKGLQLWSAETGQVPVAGNSCIAPQASITGGVCPIAPGWTSNAPYDLTFNQNLLRYSGVSSHYLGKYGESQPLGSMYYLQDFYGDRLGVLFYEVGPTSDCGLPNVLTPSPDLANTTLSGAKFSMRNSTRTNCFIQVFKY